MDELQVVGKSPVRIDAMDKVHGHAKYTNDFSMPGMLRTGVRRPNPDLHLIFCCKHDASVYRPTIDQHSTTATIPCLANAGYCTPGFVQNGYALLSIHPDASDEVLEEWMSSNLCRCTGYQEIQSAMKDLIQNGQGER